MTVEQLKLKIEHLNAQENKIKELEDKLKMTELHLQNAIVYISLLNKSENDRYDKLLKEKQNVGTG